MHPLSLGNITDSGQRPKRAALLKHVSLFDSSASEVTVSGGRLFTRYIAYKYYGDGDDNMGASSLSGSTIITL